MQTSVSRILGKTGEVLRTRFGGLVGLWGVFFAAQIVLFMILAAVIGASTFGALAAGAGGAAPESGLGGLGAGIIVTIILAYVVILLISLAQSSSLIAYASPLQKLSFGDALNSGVRSALPMVGVALLLLVAYFVVAFLVALVLGLLGSVSSALSGLIAILLIPAGIYAASRICTINAVVAVDRVTNPINAIAAGWTQTRGSVWAILGAMVIFLVALVVVGGLLAWPLISASISAGAGGVPDLGGLGLTFLGFFLFSIAVSVVSAALIAAIHAEVSSASASKATDVFS